MSQLIQQSLIKELKDLIKGESAEKQLAILSAKFPGKVVFSTSFSEEDQLITHYIFTQHLSITVFTLDTGRLFPETYSTWSQTLEKYKQPIVPYYPIAADLEKFIQEKGPNSFYESVANRKECCHIRKVVPLQRALKGQELWITGIRAEHSPNRLSMEPVEWDAVNTIIKFHPLMNWDSDTVKKAIDKFDIPVNPLHAKGFVSIGCAPCTRAIKSGEDFRAGRWWWEDSSKKECGLHVTENITSETRV